MKLDDFDTKYVYNLVIQSNLLNHSVESEKLFLIDYYEVLENNTITTYFDNKYNLDCIEHIYVTSFDKLYKTICFILKNHTNSDKFKYVIKSVSINKFKTPLQYQVLTTSGDNYIQNAKINYMKEQDKK
jgi:hypothetical protein